MIRTDHWPVAVLALFAVIGVLGAGCGSGSTTQSASSASAPHAHTTTLSASDKAVKFAECMRHNGVSDFPDPTDANADSYGVSVTPAVFTRAAEACRALKPPGALSSKYTPKQLSAGVRFARCVRAKGVKDFPDPVDGEPLIDTTKIPSSNRPGGMTILNAATDKCSSLLRRAMGGQ